LARRHKKEKGVCIVNLKDEDIIENIDLAANKKMQPIFIWLENTLKILGHKPTEGLRDALCFAMDREEVRSADYVIHREGMGISNASSKFKALWNDGFLLRKEAASASGGVEHVYSRIG